MNVSCEPKICFILGISQRSGTNFLYRVLNLHPHCAGPGPVWEDCFLQHADALATFAENMYDQWDSGWEVENKLGGPKVLVRCFGEAIEKFLRQQLSPQNIKITESQGIKKTEAIKVFLTKTPSALGLERFLDLFPEAKLILLVRDGRAVVESMTSSFGGGYERATVKWRDNAERMNQFLKSHEGKKGNFLLIKYEDMIRDEKHTLSRIFDFLELDQSVFNFDDLKSLGITGSSELRNNEGAVHWQRREKTADFNPLARAEMWSQKRHERFNWTAGKQMEEFGYALRPIKTSPIIYRFRNMVRDAWVLGYHSLVSTLRRVYRYYKAL